MLPARDFACVANLSNQDLQLKALCMAQDNVFQSFSFGTRIYFGAFCPLGKKNPLPPQ